jgi:hypothetical protein
MNGIGAAFFDNFDYPVYVQITLRRGGAADIVAFVGIFCEQGVFVRFG